MTSFDDAGAALVERYRATVGERAQKAIALHIRTKVRDARSDPDTAARRWPFELIQNAHDAGPRAGNTGIIMSFRLANGVLHVEHDAAPFSLDELAALLMGGSSKDFMSTETTGRFGTGFLVTHVLSEKVEVSGILTADGTHRSFKVELDRPNDEDRVLQNVRDSETSLLHSRIIEGFASKPTAVFDYVVDNEKIAIAGLEALEQVLPHLFATCANLRQISIQYSGHETTWKANPAAKNISADGIFVSNLDVSRHKADATDEWRVIRATATEHSSGRLVVALRREADRWAVCLPGRLASVFRQLPILGAPVLPGWFIIDGEFEVEQERRSIHVTGEAVRPLQDAFSALGALVLLANREGWRGGFRLAQLKIPTEIGGDTSIKVWTGILKTTAAGLAKLPLVQTATGDKLPCSQNTEHDRYADFIQQAAEGPSHNELWQLAAACRDADPPAKDVSEGWSEIAAGWEELGIEIGWLDLPGIGKRASDEVTELSQLRVQGSPFEWLSHYVDAVGKAWRVAGTTKSDLTNLIPDQHGKLHDVGALRRDGGITDQAKNISVELDIDVRSQLLNQKLVDVLEKGNLKEGAYALKEATLPELDENDVINLIIKTLSDALPEEKKLTEQGGKAAAASVALLSHLWTTQEKSGEPFARRVPLIAMDGTIQKTTSRRLMVPPVLAWPAAAKPFVDAYPPFRVLADSYGGADEPLLGALATWGIAHRDLLIASSREEINERGLRPIAINPDSVNGATLRNAELTQIALLEPEIINHCKQSRAKAEALLGLIICFVAGADTSWRAAVTKMIRTSDGEKQVTITPSLWLSDLRSKQWIPVEEGGDEVHHPATPIVVRGLLRPQWLENNPHGVELLIRHFGIDALDVRLLAAATTEEERQRLRDSLAKIVEVAGGDAQMLEEIIVEAQQRQQDVGKMRRLGLAVQERVKAAMKMRGLNVEDVDHGYDFRVTPVEVHGDDPDDLSSYFEVGDYKVEVKTTTIGEACLTPLQAETCATNPNSFVLCVVDLRAFNGDLHVTNWDNEDVSAFCRLVAGTELAVEETLSLVHGAEGSAVPIRNTTALRYAIGSCTWDSGLTIDNWVDEAFSVARAVSA